MGDGEYGTRPTAWGANFLLWTAKIYRTWPQKYCFPKKNIFLKFVSSVRKIGGPQTNLDGQRPTGNSPELPHSQSEHAVRCLIVQWNQALQLRDTISLPAYILYSHFIMIFTKCEGCIFFVHPVSPFGYSDARVKKNCNQVYSRTLIFKERCSINNVQAKFLFSNLIYFDVGSG